jgi:heme/copper-type cytochrome/quinol oxidase subunit 4
MMSFPKRILITVAIVVALTDLIMFYHVQRSPQILTLPFVVLVIIITIIPIAVSLWYCVPKYKLKW